VSQAEPAGSFYPYPKWLPRCLRIIAIWACYILIIEAISALALGEFSTILAGRINESRLGREAEKAHRAEVPALARWDSFWYLNIAEHGYAGDYEESGYSAGFLPLYPWSIRAVRALGVDPVFAALWIARLSLLASCFWLWGYLGESDQDENSVEAVIISLLAFPSAFILVSVYSESLFLMCAVASIYLVRRGKYLGGALCAGLAMLTRVHGVALAPTLAILAWQRRGDKRSWMAWIPVVVVIETLLILLLLSEYRMGHALAYLSVKQSWGAEVSPPWHALLNSLSRSREAVASPHFKSVELLLELPCLVFALVAGSYLLWRRKWSDGTFVLSSAGLSVFAGTWWGMPRFTLILFPLFVLISFLHKRNVVCWSGYLVAGAMLQVVFLVNFVLYGSPAP
jgi:hypothetical protein